MRAFGAWQKKKLTDAGWGRLGQLVDDATEQHGLALAGITLDPEEPVWPIAPFLEIGIVEHPAIGILEQTAFLLSMRFLSRPGSVPARSRRQA